MQHTNDTRQHIYSNCHRLVRIEFNGHIQWHYCWHQKAKTQIVNANATLNWSSNTPPPPQTSNSPDSRRRYSYMEYNAFNAWHHNTLHVQQYFILGFLLILVRVRLFVDRVEVEAIIILCRQVEQRTRWWCWWILGRNCGCHKNIRSEAVCCVVAE